MINPVFRRELTTVLRTWKTYGAVTAYALIMAVICAIYVYSLEKAAAYSGFQPSDTKGLYALIAMFQAGLILVITPALTSGAISGERERQTLDLLLITKMTPLKIVMGKLISSLFVVLLMIISSIPVFSIIFYYGGVSGFNLVALTALTMLTAAFIASVSIMFSSLFKKTLSATVMSYLVIIALGILTFVLALIIYIWTQDYYWYDSGRSFFVSNYELNGNLIVNTLILALNPAMAFISIIDSQLGTDFAWELTYDLSHIYTSKYPPFPLWSITFVLYSVLAVICIFVTVNVLNPVKNSRKFK